MSNRDTRVNLHLSTPPSLTLSTFAQFRLPSSATTHKTDMGSLVLDSSCQTGIISARTPVVV